MGLTRRGGGAQSIAFKTRVPENKGPDAGNYSVASREYHRLRNALSLATQLSTKLGKDRFFYVIGHIY